MPEDTIWVLKPHTEAKHIILRKYLDAWFPMLTSYHGRVVICDGFAGPGIYSKGEEGSPIVAINAFIDHQTQMKSEAVYVFIEKDKKRCESLKKVISAKTLPEEVKCEIINDEYEAAFGKMLDYLDHNVLRIAPTFAFIDPFGVKGYSMALIERFMSNKRCEVLITFMVEPMKRFIDTDEFEGPCDQLFGGDAWRDARSMIGKEREDFLRALYQRQLEDRTGIKYVRFFTMKNHKDVPIYDLFSGTNHPAGVDAMKAAMWKVDQTAGGYTFSDATDPTQATLFSSDPDWEQLWDMLVSKYAGETVSYPIVAEFIRNTPFRILKTPIKKEANKDAGRFQIWNPEGARKNVLNESSSLVFPKKD